MMTPRALAAASLLFAACRLATPAVLPEAVAARCSYVNPFSDGAECRDYLGDWDLDRAAQDCADWRGTFEAGERCDADGAAGWCVLGGDAPIRIAFADGTCAENQRGCEIFAGGAFLAEGTCAAGGDDPGVLARPFPEPVEVCVEPLDGDAPGAGEDGKVCQWITMQGCTEPGRAWEDYGSCDAPRQQRPYYPVPVDDDALVEDPRLQDAVYVAELAWVKSEIASCSCVCCHSLDAPEGPANWYLEQPGNFANGLFDTGVAMGAGALDTTVLGALPPEQNNGFTRLPSIFPSTDPARMQAFWLGELVHRGLDADEIDPYWSFGPLTDQQDYVPAPCAGGEGVDDDGAIAWTGGPARILWVLEPGAPNPGVPPNLDTPPGTLWRVDAVDPTRALIEAATYGVVPDGARQRVPSSGAPPVLVPGDEYLLYVAADYVQPITRCLFVAP